MGFPPVGVPASWPARLRLRNLVAARGAAGAAWGAAWRWPIFFLKKFLRPRIFFKKIFAASEISLSPLKMRLFVGPIFLFLVRGNFIIFSPRSVPGWRPGRPGPCGCGGAARALRLARVGWRVVRGPLAAVCWAARARRAGPRARCWRAVGGALAVRCCAVRGVPRCVWRAGCWLLGRARAAPRALLARCVWGARLLFCLWVFVFPRAGRASRAVAGAGCCCAARAVLGRLFFFYLFFVRLPPLALKFLVKIVCVYALKLLYYCDIIARGGRRTKNR